MRPLAGMAGASLALLIGGGVLAAPALLKMDQATQTRLGVVTAPLQAAYHSTTETGFARALDPGPLAQLQSDIATAVAAAAASKAEADRTKALNAADQTVSKQAAEAAAAQARGDAAKLEASAPPGRAGVEPSAGARYSGRQAQQAGGATSPLGALRLCASIPPPACRRPAGWRPSTSGPAEPSARRSWAPPAQAIRGCSPPAFWRWSAVRRLSSSGPAPWRRRPSPRGPARTAL